MRRRLKGLFVIGRLAGLLGVGSGIGIRGNLTVRATSPAAGQTPPRRGCVPPRHPWPPRLYNFLYIAASRAEATPITCLDTNDRRLGAAHLQYNGCGGGFA